MLGSENCCSSGALGGGVDAGFAATDDFFPISPVGSPTLLSSFSLTIGDNSLRPKLSDTGKKDVASDFLWK